MANVERLSSYAVQAPVLGEGLASLGFKVCGAGSTEKVWNSGHIRNFVVLYIAIATQEPSAFRRLFPMDRSKCAATFANHFGNEMALSHGRDFFALILLRPGFFFALGVKGSGGVMSIRRSTSSRSLLSAIVRHSAKNPTHC